MREVLAANVHSANIPCMVVTMGGQGAVYASHNGESGIVPAKKVNVIDTTGAGDAFFAGTVIGLTYGKNLAQSCEIGALWNSGWIFLLWTESISHKVKKSADSSFESRAALFLFAVSPPETQKEPSHSPEWEDSL